MLPLKQLQIELKEDERIDYLKQINCQIIQKKTGFSFGIDAVLLADYVLKNQKKSGNLFDLCSGNGIIPLLLSFTDKVESIKAIEIQLSAEYYGKKYRNIIM